MASFQDVQGSYESLVASCEGVDVKTVHAKQHKSGQVNSLDLLLAGARRLDTLFPTAESNLIEINTEIRKEVETAIESIVNMISVAERTPRKFGSPTPSVAFIPEGQQDKEYLDRVSGINLFPRMIPTLRERVDVFKYQTHLADRIDGVFLLAEAISQNHSTGQFHEFVRFFERAFKRSCSELVKPMSLFLSGTRFGYTEAEIKKWLIQIRHPATHSDRRRDIVLESDTRLVTYRMEQAAYDILFNKTIWRSSSSERRNLWDTATGTVGEGSSLFATRGKPASIGATFLDEFCSYQRNLDFILSPLPVGWWAKFPEPTKFPANMTPVIPYSGARFQAD